MQTKAPFAVGEKCIYLTLSFLTKCIAVCLIKQNTPLHMILAPGEGMRTPARDRC